MFFQQRTYAPYMFWFSVSLVILNLFAVVCHIIRIAEAIMNDVNLLTFI